MIKFWFDQFDQSRASHRLRAQIPIDQLIKENFSAKIISSITEIDTSDIVIFSKDSKLENFLKIKKLGVKIGFDICDNYFNDPSYNYNKFCKEADFIIANSAQMQTLIKEHTSKDSFYLVDPYERKIIAPQINTKRKINLLWYGGKSSLKFVDWITLLKNLKLLNIDYSFTICGGKVEKILRYIRNDTQIDNEKIFFREWSWDIQEELLAESDIIVIPVNLNSKKIYHKLQIKSHNRLVDGLAQGKWVIGSKIPSYINLQDFCWLDEDVNKGIQFYINNPVSVKQKILNGQEWIKENASPALAADQLKKIYKSVKTNEKNFKTSC